MLGGAPGPARRWAIGHQLELGRWFRARDFVPVAQAHIMADTESLGEPASHEAHGPFTHSRSVACARGSVWRKRCRRRLLVHVLADWQSLSQETARGKQGGLPRGREARSASGLARLRRRYGRWLVPAD